MGNSNSSSMTTLPQLNIRVMSQVVDATESDVLNILFKYERKNLINKNAYLYSKVNAMKKLNLIEPLTEDYLVRLKQFYDSKKQPYASKLLNERSVSNQMDSARDKDSKSNDISNTRSTILRSDSMVNKSRLMESQNVFTDDYLPFETEEERNIRILEYQDNLLIQSQLHPSKFDYTISRDDFISLIGLPDSFRLDNSFDFNGLSKSKEIKDFSDSQIDSNSDNTSIDDIFDIDKDNLLSSVDSCKSGKSSFEYTPIQSDKEAISHSDQRSSSVMDDETTEFYIHPSDAEILLNLFDLIDAKCIREVDLREVILAFAILIPSENSGLYVDENVENAQSLMNKINSCVGLNLLNLLFTIVDRDSSKYVSKSTMLRMIELVNNCFVYFGDNSLSYNTITDLADSIFTSAGIFGQYSESEYRESKLGYILASDVMDSSNIQGLLYYPNYLNLIAEHPIIEILLSRQFQENALERRLNAEEILLHDLRL